MSSAKRQKSRRIRKWAAVLGIGAVVAQQVGQAGKLAGGLLGDLLGGLRGAEALRLVEDGAQVGHALGRQQIVQVDAHDSA